MGTGVTQGETIVAIATAIVPQQGSVGIVRMSGAEAKPLPALYFMRLGNNPGRATASSMATSETPKLRKS